jgi:hypothetical protein
MWFEASVDENDMGRLGRTGVFVGGGVAGVVHARLRFGPIPDAQATIGIIVCEDRVAHHPSGDRGGPDIPHILFCGDMAPGREEYGDAERTENGGPDYPTIIDFLPQWQRPPEVIWINHRSKEAEKMRRHGSRSIVKLDSETSLNFVVLKCFEILRRLRVRQEFQDRPQNYEGFLLSLSQAEMDTTPFLDAGFELVESLQRRA